MKSYSQDNYVLLLTSEEKIFTLQEDTFSLEGRPSISSDGSVVASVHRISRDQSRYPIPIASTYSMKDRKWTDHPELEWVWGSVAISPDGSQLACFTRDIRSPYSGSRLQILNFKTGKITVVTKPWQRPGPSGISWSPDARYLAFEMSPFSGRFSAISAIYVLKIETGEISQIGLGESPSWSPSGEWIAYASYVQLKDDQSEPRNSWFYDGHYYSNDARQFSLMSTVGTHNRVLMKFNSGVEDRAMPVWSPDSKTLLLTRVRDPDDGTEDIYMLDVASSHRVKKFPNTIAEVYGWINAPTVDPR
jgi:Tol biopolymer transport system component